MTQSNNIKPSRISRTQVADLVRMDIVNGKYQPGDQMPTREELLARIPAAYMTIQRGLDQLREEGFVVARKGDGTYVVSDPPHLNHYAMVIHRTESLADKQGPFFFHQAMVEATRRFNQTHADKQLTCYFDVHPHTGCASYMELVDLVRHHRLAGLIFLESINPFFNTPLLTEPHLGRVTASPPVAEGQDVPCVTIDIQAFLTRSLDLLVKEKRRRVAVFLNDDMFAGDEPEAGIPSSLAEAIAAAGLSTRPQWNIPFCPRHSRGVLLTTRLLFDRPAAERPDGLILMDDHLVEAVTEGVFEAGIDAMTDLSVIGYSNFPLLPRSLVPITRLGFDSDCLLDLLVKTIDDQVLGLAVPPVRPLPPVFEDELRTREPVPSVR